MLSFIDLSSDLRRRIYILAGLVRVCPISLNMEKHNRESFLKDCDGWFRDHMDEPLNFNDRASMRCYYRRKRFMGQMINPNVEGFDCICPPLPMALLHVSRAIYHEVTAILFAENLFRISRTARHGLATLLSLNPRAYTWMTSLSIQLNSCSCIPGHECPEQEELDKGCPKCHYMCRVGRDGPLAISQPGAQGVMLEWNMLVDHLAQYIQPSQLRLSVICDTLDDVTAMQIAQALLRLPILAHCSLRLGQNPNSTFHILAEKTVLQVTNRSIYHLDQPFRFLDLPEEIQIHILSFTNLVSDSVVTWSKLRDTGLGCCNRCMDSLEACCCAVRHGAYTSLSCTCWSMPSSLFLINRRFYKYGIEIFYSRNRFEVVWDISDEEEEIDNLIDILTSLPPIALPYIRYLNIHLVGMKYRHFDNDHPFERSWDEAMKLLVCQLLFSDLTLQIEDVTGRGQSFENLTTGIDDSFKIEKLEWKLYQRLTRPLTNLKQPLKNFSIRFGPPPYGKYKELRDERQSILEKIVMGQMYDKVAIDRLREMSKVEPIASIFRPDGVQVWPLS